MLPADFEMATRYGVDVDWPLRYDDLENFYTEAEHLLQVAGSSEHTPAPRSAPYPQPPHRLCTPSQVLHDASPDDWYVMPTARPSRPTPSGRPPCCNNGVCFLCPIDSKFTIRRDLAEVYDDPRVTLRTRFEVVSLDVEGGTVRGVVGRSPDGDERVAGDVVVLGANAIFNAAILLRSGDDHPELGRGLNEQRSVKVRMLLDGLDAFDGSTVITGHGYADYDGAHRATRAGTLIEVWNEPTLRLERGRWRQAVEVKLIYESSRSGGGVVTIDGDNRPIVESGPGSAREHAALAIVTERLPILFGALPVESVEWIRPQPTEAHLLGTTPMGNDPATSVVDVDGVHHRWRNVLVPGTGVFPTSSPANPTLTATALALRGARRVFGGPS
jgi:choline dehydrogenase-like flavoprotein